MLIVKRERLYSILLALVLLLTRSLGITGMYRAQPALAGVSPITRGYSGRVCASLMFNIDWGEEHLPALLDILLAKGVRATFFPTGTWAEDHKELAARLVADGHEVGNHGGAHDHVERMGKEDLKRLIKLGEERIEAACGVRPARLFAPPYGEWTADTVRYALECGYETVLWTVDTVDWRLPAPETIWKRALGGAVPGALVLMHPTEPTVVALPTLIDGLREKGYQIVTVSENLSAER